MDISQQESDVTDQELIDGLRSGSPPAAEELLSRFEGPLVRFFRASLPVPDNAEDATQEVFIRLIESVRAGRTGEVRSLTSLVFTIARRLSIDAGRQWSRRPKSASLDAPVGDADAGLTIADAVPDRRENPREAAARRERDLHVAAALRELDEETRAVITLRHIDGLSSREVAEVLGVAEGTVWSRLHRGLALLKSRLTPKPITPSSRQSRMQQP